MPRPGRRRVPRRRRVFVGCEGESEQGYARRLQDLSDQAGARFHLDAVPLGGGDPLAIVERATAQMARRAIRAPYERAFVLVDADVLGHSPARDDQIERTAGTVGLAVVWQRPTFEAVLLRHLPGRDGHRPASTADALNAIEREVPTYAKPMSAAQLAPLVDGMAVRRAAAVEDDLAPLLRLIGLV